MASIFKPKRTAVKRDSNGKPIILLAAKKKAKAKAKASKTSHNTGHGTGHKKTKKSKK